MTVPEASPSNLVAKGNFLQVVLSVSSELFLLQQRLQFFLFPRMRTPTTTSGFDNIGNASSAVQQRVILLYKETASLKPPYPCLADAAA